MPHSDSIDKIVESYFLIFSKVPFQYKRRNYCPKPVVVSPLLLRGFTCPERCGACCATFAGEPFTLDWIPGEPSDPPEIIPRTVIFNGKQVTVRSYICTLPKSKYCAHVMLNGRCAIHGLHPFACDFELIRPIFTKDPSQPNRLLSKLHGRGWAMTRVDGQKRAMCEMTKVTPDTITEVVRKLHRMGQWMEHFGFNIDSTHLPAIIKWIGEGAKEDLLLKPEEV